MPRYTAHLTAPDGSGHFRRIVIVSESEEEARAAIMRREYAKCASYLQPADLELIRADAGLDEDAFAKVLPRLLDPKRDLLDTLRELGISMSGGSRAQLVAHRQTEPYEIDWIVEGRNPGRTKGWKRAGR